MVENPINLIITLDVCFITGGEARLFEEQDLGGGLVESEGEELLGFVPDARTPKKTVTMATHSQQEEDSSDLLQ